MMVKIDGATCSGFGNCVFAAPDVFDIDPATNIAFVVTEHLDDSDLPAISEAIADCPARALSLSP